ncbi:MAG TPA: acetylxylan esterase [Balneolales bacterium]|nr:acetylxylan esterase [Balneolales bacterium]
MMKKSIRHACITATILLLSFGPALAQKKYKVLPWKSQISEFQYLMQHVHQQYKQRLEDLNAAIESPISMREYRNSRRERFLKLLGHLPPGTPLHAGITGKIQRDGYHIEKVIYQSFPNHHVTANLYVPDGKGPFPGVLFFCGHEMTSKATPSYQKTAILFATHGFVVLVIDPISQSERIQLTDKQGHNLTRGATTEHTMLNAGSNLVGTSVVAYQLWDNERGLDYLLSRPEVDTTRIGVVGNSGGGTQATYFMAYEPRAKVAAPCSFVTRRTKVFLTIGPQDGCWWMPFEGRERLDIGDYLIMHAPKPLLILSARYDFFNYVGTKETYEKMKQVYRTLGAPEKVKKFTWSDGHGISKPKREAVVTWFRRWFYHDTTKVKEGDIKILTSNELQCTPTGQVNTSFPNEVDVQDHNLVIADSLRKVRKDFQEHSTHAEFLAQIRKTLGLPASDNTQINLDWRGSAANGNYSFKKVIIRRKGQVPLPALVAYPNGKTINKVVVWFDEKGKSVIADSTSLMEKYLNQGDAVILADMRGMGETLDPKQYNAWKYYDHEYRNVMISLHIGHPLMGQRVEDVFTVMDFIHSQDHLNGKTVEIYATGTAAPAVLHAAVFNKQISKIYLYHTLASFRYILEHPRMMDAYSYVLPNVLRYYDLPDLVRLVGKDKVVYHGSI